MKHGTTQSFENLKQKIKNTICLLLLFCLFSSLNAQKDSKNADLALIPISNQNFTENINRFHWLLKNKQSAEAKTLSSKLFNYANTSNNLSQKIASTKVKIEYYGHVHEGDSIAFYMEELLVLVEEDIPDEKKAAIYVTAGNFFRGRVDTNNNNYFEKGISLCKKGLELVDKSVYSPTKIQCQYCIEQGISAFNQSYEYDSIVALPKIRDLWFEAVANNDSSNILGIGIKVMDYCRGHGMLDSLILMEKRLTDFLKHYRVDNMEVTMLSMRASIALMQGDPEGQIQLLNKSLQLLKSKGNLRAAQGVYIRLSHAYQGKRDFRNSKLMLDSALLAAPNMLTGHINWLIYQLFKNEGNKDSILHYLERTVEFSNQDFLLKQTKMMEEFKAKHQTQEAKAALEKEQIQRNWLLLFISIILLIVLILIWAYRRQLSIQKQLRNSKNIINEKNKTLEVDKKIIEMQAESLRDLDKIKSRFFANISHELRTPLTLMLGPINSALKSNALNNKNFTYLKLAQKNGKDLLRLVNEILSLIKLENDKLILEEKTISLYKFSNRIAANFESHAQKRAIKFEFHYLPSEYLNLSIDAQKVEHVLNNLLSNAMKFTPAEGQVIFQVKEMSNRIQIQIQDTGIGIHEMDLPNIFDRFYQSKRPHAGTSGGTGIGLALSQELANLMKGKLWAESIFGEGSTFYFEFPKKEVLGALEVEEEVISSELLEVSGEQPQITNHQSLITILIVEDNPNLSQYISMILSENYQTRITENGKSAIDYLESVKKLPDLILSDLMMPLMDGFQLLEQLKSTDKFRHIPVVMLTARAEQEDKLKALRIGVDDYLIKPFDEIELKTRIENLLQNTKNRQILLPENTEINQNPNESEQTKQEFTQEELDWLKALETNVLKEMVKFSFSVNQLANQMAINRWSLNKNLKKLTGLTTEQYIRETRLNQARRLLESKKVRSVKEVCYEVGLKDTQNFSRHFQKRFGKSPSELL